MVKSNTVMNLIVIMRGCIMYQVFQDKKPADCFNWKEEVDFWKNKFKEHDTQDLSWCEFPVLMTVKQI
jgi:hypothetical protein